MGAGAGLVTGGIWGVAGGWGVTGVVCWILVGGTGDCFGSGCIGGGFLEFVTLGGAGFVALMYGLVILETFWV